MTAARAKTVELRLPSRLGYEKVAMSTAASTAKLVGFRPERIEDLKTAVAEACINAIEHGNRLNEKLSVVVILSADDEVLEIKVMDDGKGMNALPTKPDIDRKMHGEEDPRGMGMFLIQALVDEAEWVVGVNGKGSYVRLVIRLDKDA
jgi:serine/threonine-protein kinase RsbW